nr:iron ABC transporter permease [Alsobacter metallidurans]
MSRTRNGPVLAFAALVAALSLLPMGFVGWIAYQTGWDAAFHLVVRVRVAELLWNTALLELCVLPPAIVVALATAWLTQRTNLPFAPFWSWLAVAPLAIPAFVQSYAWTTVAPSFHGLPAAALISVLAYSPFLYLPIAAQIRRLDPAQEDAAASMGLGPWQVFFRVVLPQLRLGISGGALLVALHLLSEYGLYALIRFDTFTTAIMDQFQSAYNAAAANMLGGVLVLACVGLIGLDVILRGQERYARIGSGAARIAARRDLGAFKWPALAGLTLLGVLAIGVPCGMILRWLAVGGGAVWTAGVFSALGETMLLSLAGALLTTVAAAPMAWISVRSPGRTQRILEACHYYVGSLPGVVVGLALVWITVQVALPLYQTMFTVMVAYALLFLPRAMAGLRPSLAQAPVELEQAAMALGRTPFQAVSSVTLRLAAPGAAASIVLVSLGAATELTATLMLAPNGVRTLATAFWSLTGEIDYAAAAPYAAMMIIASLPLTIILHAQSRRIAGR